MDSYTIVREPIDLRPTKVLNIKEDYVDGLITQVCEYSDLDTQEREILSANDYRLQNVLATGLGSLDEVGTLNLDTMSSIDVVNRAVAGMRTIQSQMPQNNEVKDKEVDE